MSSEPELCKCGSDIFHVEKYPKDKDGLTLYHIYCAQCKTLLDHFKV